MFFISNSFKPGMGYIVIFVKGFESCILAIYLEEKNWWFSILCIIKEANFIKYKTNVNNVDMYIILFKPKKKQITITM